MYLRTGTGVGTHDVAHTYGLRTHARDGEAAEEVVAHELVQRVAELLEDLQPALGHWAGCRRHRVDRRHREYRRYKAAQRVQAGTRRHRGYKAVQGAQGTTRWVQHWLGRPG